MRRINRWLLNGYKINKDSSDAIVYYNRSGKNYYKVYYKYDDIAAVNPTFSKEDFDSLKKISDDSYEDIDKGDHAESRRCYLVDDYSTYGNKADIRYAEKIRTDELAGQLNNALDLLTKTQRRRLLLYFVHKKSTRKIAKLEKVDHKAVLDSINAARAKIKAYFGRL